jgi:hypothetical protein
MHIVIQRIVGPFLFEGLTDSQVVKNKLRKEIMRVTREEGQIQKRILDKLTYDWWAPETIVVEYEEEEKSNLISVKVFIDNMYFYFVDQGTSVRYATMDKDYKVRSESGKLTLKSRGLDGVAYINTKEPRPGIAPRNFIKTLEEKRRKKFQTKIANAVSRVLRTERGW